MKIIIRNEADKQTFINLIADRKIIEGKKYIGEFKQIQSKRTLDQNALFHLWCNVIESETGQSADDVKEYIKQKFMPAVTKQIFDLDVQIWRTRDLNTLEFYNLLRFFKEWAMDTLGIPLLTLEDRNFMEFYETYR